MLARPFIKCDSCEELKTVLQSVEGKINELSSSMYSKEQHDNLLYDFGKSVNFINEWKCLILRCENQEIAKQSFIQNLTEDSVFIVMDWAMKFLQRRFREKQCDWYVKRGMNWHVSCAITSDGRGIFSFPSTTTYSAAVHRIGSLCCPSWRVS